MASPVEVRPVPECELESLLSPRQRQVLELAARGRTNKLIAHELRIAPQTVKNHTTQVLRKLRVLSMREAVLRVYGCTAADCPLRQAPEVDLYMPFEWER